MYEATTLRRTLDNYTLKECEEGTKTAKGHSIEHLQKVFIQIHCVQESAALVASMTVVSR